MKKTNVVRQIMGSHIESGNIIKVVFNETHVEIGMVCLLSDDSYSVINTANFRTMCLGNRDITGTREDIAKHFNKFWTSRAIEEIERIKEEGDSASRYMRARNISYEVFEKSDIYVSVEERKK